MPGRSVGRMTTENFMSGTSERIPTAFRKETAVVGFVEGSELLSIVFAVAV